MWSLEQLFGYQILVSQDLKLGFCAAYKQMKHDSKFKKYVTA